MTRYTVGKITPIQRREVRSTDFGARASFWMSFPKEGSQLTPSHQSEDFKWKDYCPMVFRFASRDTLIFFWMPIHSLSSFLSSFFYPFEILHIILLLSLYLKYLAFKLVLPCLSICCLKLLWGKPAHVLYSYQPIRKLFKHFCLILHAFCFMGNSGDYKMLFSRVGI